MFCVVFFFKNHKRKFRTLREIMQPEKAASGEHINVITHRIIFANQNTIFYNKSLKGIGMRHSLKALHHQGTLMTKIKLKRTKVSLERWKTMHDSPFKKIFKKKTKFKRQNDRSQKWKRGNATDGEGNILGIEGPRSQGSHFWGKTENPGTRLGIKLSIKTLSSRANYSKWRHKGRFTNRILRHRFAQ